MLTIATQIVNPISPFDFGLSAMIFSDGNPEIRKYENGKFWQVISVQGKLILTTIAAAGTVEEPKLQVKLKSNEKITGCDKEKAEEIVRVLFNLDFDVKPFYEHVRKDSVMAGLAQRLRGLKSPTTPTVFEALIDSIVEQQISLSISNKMEEVLIKSFGKVLRLNKKIYYAFPTPQELASASPHKLRNCGLSQRKAEYIRDISKMIIEGKLDLEKLKDHEEANDIIIELDKIRGIGTWTAELTLVRGMQRLEAFPADDIGLRRVISHYYCNDRKISSEKARRIAENWGKWKGLAAFYLIVAREMDVNIP